MDKITHSVDLDVSSPFKQFKHVFKMFEMTAKTAQSADLEVSSRFKHFNIC
jgi:hypothetical protein